MVVAEEFIVDRAARREVSRLSAVKTVPFLLGYPITILAIPLDVSGAVSISTVVPDLSSSLDVFMQYFGIEIGGPNGNIYASNGRLVPVFDY